MSKYIGLARLLADEEGPVEYSLEELESTLNIEFPASARNYAEWWGNSEKNTQAARGWMAGGYRVASVNLNHELVRFEPFDEEEGEGEVWAEQAGRGIERDEGERDVETAREFEDYARACMASTFNVDLSPGRGDGVRKLFDFMSPDGSVVGEAKFYSMVKGKSIPPAKFSSIAEHVWLLEKKEAVLKFLVFGNDRRVPEGWLERYGSLVTDVEFYFLGADGEPERLPSTPENCTHCPEPSHPRRESCPIPDAPVYAVGIDFMECRECHKTGKHCLCWESLDDVTEKYTDTVAVVPCANHEEADAVTAEAGWIRSYLLAGPLPEFPLSPVLVQRGLRTKAGLKPWRLAKEVKK